MRKYFLSFADIEFMQYAILIYAYSGNMNNNTKYSQIILYGGHCLNILKTCRVVHILLEINHEMYLCKCTIKYNNCIDQWELGHGKIYFN